MINLSPRLLENWIWHEILLQDRESLVRFRHFILHTKTFLFSRERINCEALRYLEHLNRTNERFIRELVVVKSNKIAILLIGASRRHCFVVKMTRSRSECWKRCVPFVFWLILRSRCSPVDGVRFINCCVHVTGESINISTAKPFSEYNSWGRERIWSKDRKRGKNDRE